MAAPARLTTLRRRAVLRSLFTPTALQSAIDRLGFVQADPIRSPARAQDLILRHRVAGYRAGDLEREYASLDVEEDYLYAYGFVSRRVWQTLHPRKSSVPRRFERKVLDTVTGLGEAHPRTLEAHLGARRVVNAWGGFSKATTHALEWLHWRGLLRVARRESGIRIYRPVEAVTPMTSPADRLRELLLVYVGIFAPAPERSLLALLARHRDLGNPRRTYAEMLKSGTLERVEVDGIGYVWPAADATNDEAPRLVRFLAPFDPLVWDRARFEHFWGWAYRFEAYTPVPKRVRGYYAMPLLWRDRVVGWVTAARASDPFSTRAVNVDVGFAGKPPRERDFRSELDDEIARLEVFLQPR